MRHLLSILAAAVLVCACALPALAQYENCLFFSEYMEGSSYNKAIEIFNATEADVDLETVEILLYSNGNSVANATMTLAPGILPNGGTYVVCHGSSIPEILALADETNNSVINWNGDDAVELRLNGVTVDVIGQIGFDPGSYWGVDPNTTQNHTLRRMMGVCCGDWVGSDPFDPVIEWDTFDIDVYDGLGAHTHDCQAVANDVQTFGSVKALYR